MTAVSARALTFDELGQPLDVLKETSVEVPDPPAAGIRVRVVAAGLNPADAVMCVAGFMQSDFPRGIGYDVAGVVDAVGAEIAAGDGVHETVEVGDLVFGTADLVSYSSAGAAEEAILDHWTRVPEGLDPVQAGAFPMVVQTAAASLERLELQPGQTVLINGAGGMVGFSAVQIARRMGLEVIATAGPSLTPDLEGFGARVTMYGEGMPERVRDLNDGRDVDGVLDTSPPQEGTVAALLETVGGDGQKVVTISNHDEARELGARVNIDEMAKMTTTPEELFPRVARMAAEGSFRLPIAKTFPLSEWKQAAELAFSNAPHGKVVLLPEEK